MGRHDQPVPDGRLADFAKGLRELRRKAGNPSYQRMAAESGYSSLTLSAAAAGRQLPPLTVTLAYVSACGGDVAAWADHWRALSARLGEADHASLIDTGTHEPVPAEAAEPPRRGRERLLLVLAGLVVAGVVAALVLQGNVSMPVDVAAWTQEPVAPSSEPAVRPAAEPPPEYRAVTGPACPMDFTRQTHISSALGEDGWREARGGSWTGDDCDDRFLYSTLVYDNTAAQHPENYFQWRFMFNGAATRRCLAEVYVPDSPNASALVWYEMADRLENIETAIGRFSVDQSANRGRWLSAATVTVDTDVLMIQIGGNGQGLPPGRNAVAAGPLRVTCSRR